MTTMRLYLVVAATLLVFRSVESQRGKEPGDATTVRIRQGALRGVRETSLGGTSYVRFSGIPYAAPPVGNLRFKPPQTPKSWKGVRDASYEGNICFQPRGIQNESAMHEDCLFLNVYTTELPSTKTTPKAVMVWFHEGGFNYGSGNRGAYGPDYLIKAGVVIVTINYRLSVFGFLSLHNREVSGNMGLKDQVAALKWVQENIAAFGGDPKSVTIFGESAGGASVQFHMLSPLSKGLFHRGISQSGTPLAAWAISTKNRERAFQVGEKLGCKTKDANILLDCLLKEDARKIMEVTAQIIPPKENLAFLKYPFLPNVERASPGAFISEHPKRAWKEGRFEKIPYISGLTSAEGILMVLGVRATESGWSIMNTNFDKQLPELPIPIKEFETKIRQFYFNNKPMSEETVYEYIDFQTDFTFTEGIYETVKQATALSHQPVYFYVFKYDGALGYLKRFANITDLKGAAHGDDNGYLFNPTGIGPNVGPDSPEMKTVRRMVKLWTNFAKTGNPTPYLDEDISTLWKPFAQNASNCYFSIDKELSTACDLDMKRIHFWEDLFKGFRSVKSRRVRSPRATLSVRTAQGKLRGSKERTRAGTAFVRFSGIPYAAPPVGSLRFKPPQPPTPWKGVRDALEEGPICTQITYDKMDEDCLFLNVYTPTFPKRRARRAVMMWVHEGGFALGSGNRMLFGPDYLLDAGVVVVTINYRLSIFGFLSLNNSEVPGNMGLKDQVAALKWIQNNIVLFGGNPKSVTIFGDSAGAASAQFHMMSPLSKGLFHKAIAQGGSAMMPAAMTFNVKETAFEVGKRIGCHTSDTNILLNCLMAADARKLIIAAAELIPPEENVAILKYPFLPTVEPEAPDAFLSEHPMNALRQGHLYHVPYLTGVNAREGIFNVIGVRLVKSGWSIMNSNFEKQFSNVPIPMKEFEAKIRNFYFHNMPISEDTVYDFIDFQTDFHFLESVYKTAKLTAAVSHRPVYFYMFKFDGALGYLKHFTNTTDLKGPGHGDELGYIFTPYQKFVNVSSSSPEMKVLHRMVKLWTNFAKTGNPTPPHDKYISTTWRPFTQNTTNCYFSIDTEVSYACDLNMKRIKFWEDLYEDKL